MNRSSTIPGCRHLGSAGWELIVCFVSARNEELNEPVQTNASNPTELGAPRSEDPMMPPRFPVSLFWNIYYLFGQCSHLLMHSRRIRFLRRQIDLRIMVALVCPPSSLVISVSEEMLSETNLFFSRCSHHPKHSTQQSRVLLEQLFC